MNKENSKVEIVEAEKPIEEVEMNQEATSEVSNDNNDSIKVMERYATAPSVSHLLVLIVSLLFIAAIITPNIAYIYNGGFAAGNIIEANNFVLEFLNQMKWNILGVNPTDSFSLFLKDFVAPCINPILGVEMTYPIVPFIVTCCLGAGLVASLFCAIYSFICVVGGIGRKHAVRLSYVLLVFGFIAFFPAFFMSGVSIHNVIQGLEGATPMVWALIPGIGLLLAIILVIICHVTYNKHIKYTITAKQAAKLEAIEAEATNDSMEELEQAQPIENAEFIEPIAEETKAEETVEEFKPVEDVAPVEEVVEEKVEVVEHVEEPLAAPIAEQPVKSEQPTKPMTQTVKIPVITEIDLTKGLPENITELGDHQFSKNLDIEIADIPEGIDKIGPACFANCLNLKIVNLPRSLEKISFNAFFACKKLTKINYAGTKVEWKKIVRGSNWLTSAGTKVVICSDGAISVNPFH